LRKTILSRRDSSFSSFRALSLHAVFGLYATIMMLLLLLLLMMMMMMMNSYQ